MSLPTMSLAAPIASTSKSDPNVSNPNPVSLSKRLEDQRQSLLDQRDILDRLADGEGIATHEWDGVVEQCFVCRKFMLGAIFKDHSRDCWNLSEDESDVDKWGM